jgi:hypothetical protein
MKTATTKHYCPDCSTPLLNGTCSCIVCGCEVAPYILGTESVLRIVERWVDNPYCTIEELVNELCCLALPAD